MRFGQFWQVWKSVYRTLLHWRHDTTLAALSSNVMKVIKLYVNSLCNFARAVPHHPSPSSYQPSGGWFLDSINQTWNRKYMLYWSHKTGLQSLLQMGFFRTFSVRYMSTKTGPFNPLGSRGCRSSHTKAIHTPDEILKKIRGWRKTCCFTHVESLIYWPTTISTSTPSTTSTKCWMEIRFWFDKRFLHRPDFVEAPNLRSLGLSAAAALFFHAEGNAASCVASHLRCWRLENFRTGRIWSQVSSRRIWRLEV